MITERQKARVAYGFDCGCFEARRRAIESSAKHNIVEHLPIILRILHDDTDDEIQLAAIIAIGKLGSHQQVPLLEQILQTTPFDDFKEAVTTSISQIQTRQV